MNDILYNSYSDSTSTSTATVAIPNIYWSNDVITTGTITTGTYTINTNTDNITIKPATASKTTVAVEEQKFKNPYDKKIKDLLKRAREGDGAYFSNIKEYVPGKVYEFTISRSPNSIFTPVKIKTICDETDVLDLAFYLALSKFYNGKELTPEGCLQKAKSLQYEKKMIKKVSYGKKLFKLIQERDAWEKEQEEIKKARHERYVQKKIARKKKKEQKEDDRLTNAIKRAIKED